MKLLFFCVRVCVLFENNLPSNENKRQKKDNKDVFTLYAGE